MYVKKYAITILFALLCAAFSMWVDVRTGFPWNTIFINTSHSFFTGAEKWAACAMLLLLVVPDMLRAMYAKKKNPAGKSASATPNASAASGAASGNFVSGSGTAFSSGIGGPSGTSAGSAHCPVPGSCPESPAGSGSSSGS